MNLFWICGIVGAVVFVAMCGVAVWAVLGAANCTDYEEEDDTFYRVDK